MKLLDDKLDFEFIDKAIIFLLTILVIGLSIAFNIKKFSKTSSPVEEIVEINTTIDSLNRVNTKLIIETEILDSIKDVEKDKVFMLDNDSTVKLFYELIRK